MNFAEALKYSFDNNCEVGIVEGPFIRMKYDGAKTPEFLDKQTSIWQANVGHWVTLSRAEYLKIPPKNKETLEDAQIEIVRRFGCNAVHVAELLNLLDEKYEPKKKEKAK